MTMFRFADTASAITEHLGCDVALAKATSCDELADAWEALTEEERSELSVLFTRRLGVQVAAGEMPIGDLAREMAAELRFAAS